MQCEDFNALLNATGGYAGGVEEDGWTQLLNDTECDSRGLDVRGLFRLYMLQGENMQEDYDILFPQVKLIACACVSLCLCVSVSLCLCACLCLRLCLCSCLCLRLCLRL